MSARSPWSCRHRAATPTLHDVRAHLDGRVARWWLPDGVVLVDSLPRTGVGKYQKNVLREKYKGYFETARRNEPRPRPSLVGGPDVRASRTPRSYRCTGRTPGRRSRRLEPISLPGGRPSRRHTPLRRQRHSTATEQGIRGTGPTAPARHTIDPRIAAPAIQRYRTSAVVTARMQPKATGTAAAIVAARQQPVADRRASRCTSRIDPRPRAFEHMVCPSDRIGDATVMVFVESRRNSVCITSDELWTWAGRTTRGSRCGNSS